MSKSWYCPPRLGGRAKRRGEYLQASYHLPLFEGTPPNLGGEFNGCGQLLYYCHSFYNSFSLFRTIHFGCRCASIALLMRIGSADDAHRPRERWASASKISCFNREKRIVVFRNSHLRIFVNELLPSPLRFASFHYTRTCVDYCTILPAAIVQFYIFPTPYKALL